LTTSNSAFTAGDPGVIRYTCQVKKRKELDMSNPFDESVINTDAVEALTDEELDTVLAILTKAGY
jgi:hypothetical protein